MKRSRHCQFPGFRTQAVVLLTAATGFSVAHAANPVNVIFSAENALYGAGYDIGRADGWYDNKLRAAVRNYQDKTGLPTNGDLDSQTLKALGIHTTAKTTVNSNAVASREDAMAALGLSELNLRPRPQAVVKMVPRREAKPEPSAQLVSAPQETGTEEPPATAEAPASKPPEPIDDSDDKIFDSHLVKKATSTPSEVPLSAPTAILAVVSESPSKTAPAPEPETKVVDSAPPANKKPVTAVAVVAVEADDSPAQQLPAEPTGTASLEPEIEPEIDVTVAEQTAGTDNPAATNQPAKEPRRSTGGGFFRALFDFFFGWLV